ncbi:hypothetical protein PTTG_06684 [Puccinia triticina 1-1 BBBD Race 1]|uniref:CAP10 domain-containing protein n=1 Tax=Puccinia triticina (isolate 1-1 / race 1 (BBBD)) TaxID=630390 RepID=A0A180H049_PUCT1|nr:hypothetical protein PTTG_06684 [Puccinia triticina 1-1 BBBD Race 1]
MPPGGWATAIHELAPLAKTIQQQQQKPQIRASHQPSRPRLSALRLSQPHLDAQALQRPIPDPPAHPQRIPRLVRQAPAAEPDPPTRRRRIQETLPSPAPTGFKEWFTWAKENQVKLVDEFDRVNELIEPFWALPPHVLRNRTEEAGKNEAFSTFVVKDGKVKAIGAKKDAPRTIDQLKLLEVIVPHLPDVNVTMSHHDGPSVFMDWKTKQRHLDHARAGTVLPAELIDRVEDDASLWGFVGACAPDSPMRMVANGLAEELKVQHAGPGGYIGLDHAKTMDLCAHPEWQEFHGFTAWAGPRPLPLRPIFSFAQSPGFVSDILNAPLEQFEDSTKNAQQVKSWEEKEEDGRLLWRGQTTGVWFDRQTNWRKSHRVRLHRLGVAPAHSYGHSLKRRLRSPAVVLHSNASTEDVEVDDDSRDAPVVVLENEYSLAQLSKRYLSASFVGDLVQCTVEDSSCEAISKEIEFGAPVDWQFQNNFKYVLDVDGNSWSGRFRRLLKSNAVVFKSTIWPEWYRDHIQPWHHYVPVRIDYEDVFDLMSFFAGPPDPDHPLSPHPFVDGGKVRTKGFDRVAKLIADQGSQWADEHFRYQDIRAYVWRTYLEWARVSSDDRAQMNFHF